jgi:hypothetical protein
VGLFHVCARAKEPRCAYLQEEEKASVLAGCIQTFIGSASEGLSFRRAEQEARFGHSGQQRGLRLETLITVGAAAALVVILLLTHREAETKNASIAITLILWMLMLGVAIWTAALTSVRSVLVSRLPPQELARALAAVDAVSVPALPVGLLTAAAFLSGGMILLPMLISDFTKKR